MRSASVDHAILSLINFSQRIKNMGSTVGKITKISFLLFFYKSHVIKYYNFFHYDFEMFLNIWNKKRIAFKNIALLILVTEK